MDPRKTQSAVRLQDVPAIHLTRKGERPQSGAIRETCRRLDDREAAAFDAVHGAGRVLHRRTMAAPGSGSGGRKQQQQQQQQPQPQAVALVGGTRGAGKTCLILRLAFGAFTEQHEETQGLYECAWGALRLAEVGRTAPHTTQSAPSLWRSVAGSARIVLFVVDSTVPARELRAGALDGGDCGTAVGSAAATACTDAPFSYAYLRYLAGVRVAPPARGRLALKAGTPPRTPVLVLCNKQDVAGALSARAVADALELSALDGDMAAAGGASVQQRAWACLPVSLRTGAGLDEARAWIARQTQRSASTYF